MNYFSAHDDFIRENNRIHDEFDRKEALVKILLLLGNKLATAIFIVELEKQSERFKINQAKFIMPSPMMF